jgi:hypothetical protein
MIEMRRVTALVALAGPANASARKTGDCRRHIMRGGFYISLPVRIRAAYSPAFPLDDHDISIGFRVARGL